MILESDNGWTLKELWGIWEKSLYYFKQNVGGNSDTKDAFTEGSEGNEEHATRNWRQVNSYDGRKLNWTASYSHASVFQNN